MKYIELVNIRKDSFTGEGFASALRSAYDMGARDVKENGIPDIEIVSSLVHEAWIKLKLSQGVKSRKSEKGEELMVDYENLTEESKDLDRNTVKAVLDAISIYWGN